MKKIFAILCLIFSTQILAQEKTGIININSNIPNAVVLIDSVEVGKIPLRNFQIKEGKHTVYVKNPDNINWLAQDFVSEIFVGAGDTIEVFAEFEKLAKINSIPFGAKIILNDSIIGTTPSIFKQKELLGKKLKIVKEGYTEAEVIVTTSPIIEVRLEAKPGTATELRIERKNKLSIVLPLAGVGIASGAVSAYFKIQADKLYDEYLKTGNTNKLNTVKNYDRIAGITLLFFELTLIAGIYLLLTE